MNILLITPKETKNNYEQVIRQSLNSNLIGTITIVNNDLITDMEEHYHPHCIVWVGGVKNLSSISEFKFISELKNKYGYIRFIYFENDEDIENDLMNIGIYDVVTRNITNIEFNKLLKTPLKSKLDMINFNQEHLIEMKSNRKTNKINWSILLPFIALIFMLIFIIIFLFIKTDNTSNKDETELQTEISSTTELITDSSTTSTLVIVATQLPTEKSTEKSTQKPTQKLTENTTEIVTAKRESKNTNNSSILSTEPPTIAIQYKPQDRQYQTIQQDEQPQPIQQNDEQIQEVATAQGIIDDGQIYFDRENYNVKVGETFDIYVTGLSAYEGCSWNLTNSSVVKFISSGTTKVTLKALNKGSTVITGTAKSNGATRQVIVTVE